MKRSEKEMGKDEDDLDRNREKAQDRGMWHSMVDDYVPPGIEGKKKQKRTRNSYAFNKSQCITGRASSSQQTVVDVADCRISAASQDTVLLGAVYPQILT